MPTVKEIVNILNRWTGAVQASVEIECAPDAPQSIKIGIAVKVARVHDANLRGADLRGADLHGADLRCADMHGANLHGANLHGADLRDADLRDANLRGANLYGANLHDADLRGAHLRGADLRGANLHGANLRDADLRDADLRGANGAKLAIAKTRILPAGSLIGWKKLGNGVIAKLCIPEDARRSHAFGRKCRAEFVDVIEGDGVSQHDGVTKYAPGERVTCDKWCEDWTQECAGGIHFFITREEAEAY